jgi:hypothetical protein
LTVPCGSQYLNLGSPNLQLERKPQPNNGRISSPTLSQTSTRTAKSCSTIVDATSAVPSAFMIGFSTSVSRRAAAVRDNPLKALIKASAQRVVSCHAGKSSAHSLVSSVSAPALARHDELMLSTPPRREHPPPDQRLDNASTKGDDDGPESPLWVAHAPSVAPSASSSQRAPARKNVSWQPPPPSLAERSAADFERVQREGRERLETALEERQRLRESVFALSHAHRGLSDVVEARSGERTAHAPPPLQLPAVPRPLAQSESAPAILRGRRGMAAAAARAAASGSTASGSGAAGGGAGGGMAGRSSLGGCGSLEPPSLTTLHASAHHSARLEPPSFESNDATMHASARHSARLGIESNDATLHASARHSARLGFESNDATLATSSALRCSHGAPTVAPPALTPAPLAQPRPLRLRSSQSEGALEGGLALPRGPTPCMQVLATAREGALEGGRAVPRAHSAAGPRRPSGPPPAQPSRGRSAGARVPATALAHLGAPPLNNGGSDGRGLECALSRMADLANAAADDAHDDASSITGASVGAGSCRTDSSLNFASAGSSRYHPRPPLKPSASLPALCGRRTLWRDACDRIGGADGGALRLWTALTLKDKHRSEAEGARWGRQNPEEAAEMVGTLFDTLRALLIPAEPISGKPSHQPMLGKPSQQPILGRVAPRAPPPPPPSQQPTQPAQPVAPPLVEALFQRLAPLMITREGARELLLPLLRLAASHAGVPTDDLKRLTIEYAFPAAPKVDPFECLHGEAALADAALAGLAAAANDAAANNAAALDAAANDDAAAPVAAATSPVALGGRPFGATAYDGQPNVETARTPLPPSLARVANGRGTRPKLSALAAAMAAAQGEAVSPVAALTSTPASAASASSAAISTISAAASSISAASSTAIATSFTSSRTAASSCSTDYSAQMSWLARAEKEAAEEAAVEEDHSAVLGAASPDSAPRPVRRLHARLRAALASSPLSAALSAATPPSHESSSTPPSQDSSTCLDCNRPTRYLSPHPPPPPRPPADAPAPAQQEHAPLRPTQRPGSAARHASGHISSSLVVAARRGLEAYHAAVSSPADKSLERTPMRPERRPLVKEASPATGSEHGTETKHRSRLSQMAREIGAAARSNISAPRMDLAAISR